MNGRRRVTFEIESLALHGVPRAGARSLVAALERELGRLLAEPGAARALAAGPARRARVQAAPAVFGSAAGPAARSNPARDGAAIARATVGALTGGAGGRRTP